MPNAIAEDTVIVSQIDHYVPQEKELAKTMLPTSPGYGQGSGKATGCKPLQQDEVSTEAFHYEPVLRRTLQVLTKGESTRTFTQAHMTMTPTGKESRLHYPDRK
jgi:hypothetical protein